MNYIVLSIPPFDKQLKRLAKNFPSLKEEFANLIETWNRILTKERHLVEIVIKYASLLLQRGKVKVVAPEFHDRTAMNSSIDSKFLLDLLSRCVSAPDYEEWVIKIYDFICVLDPALILLWLINNLFGES